MNHSAKMSWLEEWRRLSAVFLTVLLSFTFQGAYCELVVSPAGPSQVNALAGSNVTLAVSFSGAADPTVTWSMGDLPVVTWTIGSSAPPDVAENNRKVLRMEGNGSLTFVNVPLNYTSDYTVEMTKSGLGTSLTTFTMRVFEKIKDVNLRAQPDLAIEGTEQFTLQYSMPQGVVDQQMWFFNGKEINSNSHYSVKERSLVILSLNRNDTGQYMVLLSNPFSSVTAHMNVTVLYGPDEPILEALPAQPFYVAGDSLSLSCQAEGFPRPTAEWVFGGQTLSDSQGVLSLTNIQTSQGGNYTCRLVNKRTKEKRSGSMIITVNERPLGNPNCSVQSVNNVDLQYHCWWFGGAPQAQLSFPALSNTSSGAGNFSLTVTASDNFSGKTVICVADHPIEQNKCYITASSPMGFLPAVRTTVDSEGKIVVSIHCVSEASPNAVVSWSRGNETVANGTTYQISKDTTQLKIRDYNVSNFLLQNYTCICRNPLGSQRREIQLKGPSISDSSLFPNQDGTIVTLTWEVPPNSVVTGNTVINSGKLRVDLFFHENIFQASHVNPAFLFGICTSQQNCSGFDIQMKGPAPLSKNRNGTHTRDSSNRFHTIQQKPGSARSADIHILDPDLTYRFRVIPKARMTEGEPSEAHRIGPGEGLSGSAIAGIAAGIPCSLLFLLLLGGFIYLCVYCNRKKSYLTRYPVSRAVEKTITTQIDSTPHNLRTGGLKSPPDYDRLQQTPSERSVALPNFVPPPPVRVATTV